MALIACKSCGGTGSTKSGFVRGLQRYGCESCGCNFTDTPPQGKPAAMKAMAVLLDAMGKHRRTVAWVPGRRSVVPVCTTGKPRDEAGSSGVEGRKCRLPEQHAHAVIRPGG